MVAIQLAWGSALIVAASFVAAAPTAKSVERRSTEVYSPWQTIQIKEQFPDTPFWPGNRGLVSRSNGSHNVNTLVSIDIPDEAQGEMCRYVFRNPDKLGGSKTAQLFTVIGDIPSDATFNHRPSRNNHIATFTASYNGDAEFSFGGSTFDCPAGQTLNFELVPVGDDDRIKWHTDNGFGIERI